MGPFTGVQLRVPFQVVQSSETSLTGVAKEWLFVGVREQM